MARVDLRENEYMERFVGQDHINSNDVQFWYQLLSCSFNFMRVQDPRVVDKTLDPYLVRLALNNSQSFNIGSLIRVFLDRVSRIKSQGGQSTNPYYVFQSFNALYLIRSICKSYIESLSEDQLIKSFRAQVDTEPQVSKTPLTPIPPQQYQQTSVQSQTNTEVHSINQQQSNGNATNQYGQREEGYQDNTIATAKVVEIHGGQTQANITAVVENELASKASTTTNKKNIVEQEASRQVEMTSGPTMLDQYISTLIAIIVDIPLTESTYLLQVESINALLVLLSVQMYSTTPAEQSVIYKCLMQKKCSIHALILTKTLLTNFVRQQPVPQESGSIIIGLASGLWKVLTLGYGGREEEETESMPLLSKQSLLLLNILTNHHTTEKNPYREAIVSCQDSRYSLSDPQKAFDNANNDALATATTSKSALMSNSIKIDFHELYEAICKYSNNDQVALLLYLLLQSNKIFRPYILTTASRELDRLLLPLLKVLYSSFEKGSHHVYVVLIIFIILTEETSFNEAIHKIIIRSVPWYKDRLLNEISLGSLTTLIIIRSFQYNTFRVKDKFFHSNLFATLGNLSNHFFNLHPYVCQRLVDLLERLSKRYIMATKPAHEKGVSAINQMNQTLEVLRANNPLAKALATDTYKQDLQDTSSIELDSTTTNYNNENATYQNGNAININIPDQQVPPPSQPINQDNNNTVLPPVNMQGQEYAASENSGQQSPGSNSTADHVNISIEDAKLDVALIEEVIRMILEVINNSLATQLRGNPDLIYTLLYKRSVFNSLLSSHQSFYNLVINIERILTFFYNKIEAQERPLSADEIKDIIQSTSKDWNFDQNKDNNPRILFHFLEYDQPEEFFIPYIWVRIYYTSGIVWNPKRITLFNLEVI